MKNLHKTVRNVSPQINKESLILLNADQQMKIKGGAAPKPPAVKKIGKPK